MSLFFFFCPFLSFLFLLFFFPPLPPSCFLHFLFFFVVCLSDLEKPQVFFSQIKDPQRPSPSSHCHPPPLPLLAFVPPCIALFFSDLSVLIFRLPLTRESGFFPPHSVFHIPIAAPFPFLLLGVLAQLSLTPIRGCLYRPTFRASVFWFSFSPKSRFPKSSFVVLWMFLKLRPIVSDFALLFFAFFPFCLKGSRFDEVALEGFESKRLPASLFEIFLFSLFSSASYMSVEPVLISSVRTMWKISSPLRFPPLKVSCQRYVSRVPLKFPSLG